MRRRSDGSGGIEQRQNRRTRADRSSPCATGPHGVGDAPTRQRAGRQRTGRQRTGAPWHFWLVVAMATLYLGWRAVEGVVWLVQWLAGVIG